MEAFQVSRREWEHIRKMLDIVRSKDESRGSIQHAHLKVTRYHSIWTATDGHRLAHLYASKYGRGMDVEMETIVPYELLKEKALPKQDFMIGFTQGKVHINTEDNVYAVPEMEYARFENVRGNHDVTHPEHFWDIEQSHLSRVARALMGVADTESIEQPVPVFTATENRLQVRMQTQRIGIDLEMPCDYGHAEMQQYQIAFDPKYVLDMTRQFKDALTIRMYSIDPGYSAIFRNPAAPEFDKSYHLIMPLRFKEER